MELFSSHMVIFRGHEISYFCIKHVSLWIHIKLHDLQSMLAELRVLFCVGRRTPYRRSILRTHDCTLKNHFKVPNQFILYKLSIPLPVMTKWSAFGLCEKRNLFCHVDKRMLYRRAGWFLRRNRPLGVHFEQAPPHLIIQPPFPPLHIPYTPFKNYWGMRTGPTFSLRMIHRTIK